jgi:hypothetical protein
MRAYYKGTTTDSGAPRWISIAIEPHYYFSASEVMVVWFENKEENTASWLEEALGVKTVLSRPEPNQVGFSITRRGCTGDHLNWIKESILNKLGVQYHLEKIA